MFLIEKKYIDAKQIEVESDTGLYITPFFEKYELHESDWRLYNKVMWEQQYDKYV